MIPFEDLLAGGFLGRMPLELQGLYQRCTGVQSEGNKEDHQDQGQADHPVHPKCRATGSVWTLHTEQTRGEAKRNEHHGEQTELLHPHGLNNADETGH